MLRNEARRTLDMLKLNVMDEVWTDTATGMPEVRAWRAEGGLPLRLVAFSKAKRRKGGAAEGLHFFVEDYLFEYLWRAPERYVGMLSRFGCVLAPDFSTYTDMPAPMARWQVYRRRFLCQWMQRTGMPCAYTVQTMGAEYDDDQLSGVGRGGVVAMRPPLEAGWRRDGRRAFYRQLEAVEERLAPDTVIMYGNSLSLPTNINFKIYQNDQIGIHRPPA